MALVEMCHDDALTLWYRAVDADELAILAHRVYLMQRELVLSLKTNRMECQHSDPPVREARCTNET